MKKKWVCEIQIWLSVLLLNWQLTICSLNSAVVKWNAYCICNAVYYWGKSRQECESGLACSSIQHYLQPRSLLYRPRSVAGALEVPGFWLADRLMFSYHFIVLRTTCLGTSAAHSKYINQGSLEKQNWQKNIYIYISSKGLIGVACWLWSYHSSNDCHMRESPRIL